MSLFYFILFYFPRVSLLRALRLVGESDAVGGLIKDNVEAAHEGIAENTHRLRSYENK